MMISTLFVATLVTLALPNADAIRCFECRSDVHRSCGDPFAPIGVPAVECSNLSTNPVYSCFKAAKFIGGSYVTVRGCAPFMTETFSRGFQRAFSGTYWRGSDSFSLCDYDNCNSAKSISNHFWTTLVSVILTIKLYV